MLLLQSQIDPSKNDEQVLSMFMWVLKKIILEHSVHILENY